jgi:hypothetical protein
VNISRTQLSSILAAAALACAAAPARAQAPAGPVLTPQARLADARMRPRTLATPPAPAIHLTAGQQQPRPPHLYYSVPLSAAMAFAGALAGYGIGFVALGCDDESSSCDRGPDNGEYIAAYTGMALGAAGGAHLGGLTHDSRGSFPATLAGAAVGALPLLLSDKSSDNAIGTSAAVSLATSTASAVLIDYLIRRPRH